ncbi:hypothetical protein [uncultured Sphingomonas sp.]|uniref:hypothetical protein n=1 Tax=uncultured Sphingomonas sp. TaxID=158754 RepID=UPI0025DBC6CF|nr:hypothetical protein [uncultured Sphingomonas sp.]
MRKAISVAMCSLAMLSSSCASPEKNEVLSQEQYIKGLELWKKNGPLNPHDYRKLDTCESIRINNPKSEADKNIALQDFRPFVIWGFVGRVTAPGILCSPQGWIYPFRGGKLITDMPTCGNASGTFSNLSEEEMIAYNRRLAKNEVFQRLTGCKPDR